MKVRALLLRAVAAVLLVPLAILVSAGTANAQSGQTVLDGDGTFGSNQGGMSEVLVAGPTADPPEVVAFWANRDVNWSNTTVSIRYPNVVVTGQPARVWVCLSLGVGDHQSGAGIAYSQLNLTSASGSSVSVDTGSVTSPLDDEYPNGSTRSAGSEPCLAQDIVAPAPGTSVPATVPGISLRARTVCVGCGTGVFNFSDIFGGYATGSPVDLNFAFPKVLPNTANNDLVLVSTAGTVVNPISNDSSSLFAPGSLYITSVTSDGTATCTIEGPETVKVTPIAPNTTGTCTYEFGSTEVDGYGPYQTPVGSAVITWVTLPEPQPIAGADYGTGDAWYGALNTPASTAANVDFDVDLLANDSDPQGGTLSVSAVDATSAQGGTIVDNGDGTITYSPAEGFCGDDAFQYTLTATDPDPAAAPVISTRTASGYVSITVVCNQAPIAIDDSFNVTQGATVTGTVAANDFDFEDPKADFVYTVVTPPANGTLTLGADGSYTYIHDATTTPLTDSFTYQVCDQHATMQPPTDPAVLPRCVEATATIYITLAPQAYPVAVADAAEVEAYYSADGQAATSVDIDVAANDSDADGNLDPTTVSVLSGPTAAQGLLTNNGDGTLTFEPADGFAGPVTVVYEICDDPAAATPPATTALCSSAVLLITVHGNLAPIAIDDTATVAQDSASNSIDLTANDFDPSSDGLVVTTVDATSANGGTVTNNADGTVTYTPAAGFSGTDTFNYTVCDDHTAAVDSTAVMGGDPWVRCTTGMVSVTVTETPNHPPLAIGDNATTPEDTAVDIDMLANDLDQEDTPAGIPLTVTGVEATSLMGGTVVNNGDGTATYTPATGFCGLDAFGYTIEDSAGLAAAAVVLVVVACDEPPAAEDDSANTSFNTVVNIPYTSNDTDAEDGVPALDSVDAVSTEGGAVVDNGDGTFKYTPKTGFCGMDSFTYTVVDSNGQTDTAVVNVDVTCANQDTDGDGIPDWVEVIICGTTTCATTDTDTDGDGIPDWVEVIMCGSVTCASPDNGTDTDGDGIPDWVEVIVCGTTTCATGNEDTDGDGIPDWVEVMVCGTVSCASTDTDGDGDGIPDWIEIIMCGTTSCASPDTDTDGDGIPDWIEVIICGTATCASSETDSDGDGIPDYVEVAICGTATCLDSSTDSDGDGIPDWVEYQICGTATCADGTEDTDGNGVPDWQEIATCGSAGCILDYLKTKPVGSCTNTATFTIPGTFEYDIPNGFRSNTDIRIFMYSDPVLLYSGPLPDTGKVTLSIPADTVAGKHKFMVIGVDDITGSVKIDGCYKMGELPKSSVLGATQTASGTGTTGTSSPSSVTGSSLTLPLAIAAGALLLVGGALVLLRRRREEQ